MQVLGGRDLAKLEGNAEGNLRKEAHRSFVTNVLKQRAENGDANAGQQPYVYKLFPEELEQRSEFQAFMTGKYDEIIARF